MSKQEGDLANHRYLRQTGQKSIKRRNYCALMSGGSKVKRIRMIISITLTIALLMCGCPGYPSTALAEGPIQISNIFVERTDNEVLETVKGVIEIDGSGLKDAMVRVRTTAGGGSKILGTDLGRRVANEDVFLKFELTGSEFRSILFTDGISIGSLMITVDDSNFATINSVEPKVVYLRTGQLDIKGSNLDKDKLSFGQGSFNGNIDKNASQITISNLSGDTGFHDIIFTRENTGVANVSGKVTIRRLYQNQFRAVQQMEITGLEMYPNKGVPLQTKVYFRAAHLPESSVFFVRDINDPFYVSNLGVDCRHQGNVNGDDIITVQVPNLTPGTYQVILTNFLTNPPAGTDLRNLITRQQIVGSFLVISASDAAQIVRIDPNQGPNLNHNKVTVIGQNFDELLIDGLTLNPSQTTGIQVSEDKKSLQINYGTGTYNVGTGNKEVQVTRSIKVIIGQDVEFQPADQQEFRSDYDNLRILTPTFTDSEIENEPNKDVIVELKTTLRVGPSQEYEFIEQAIREKGYFFVKSYTAPAFTELIPNSIPVVETNGVYETREDMVMSIIGRDFMVTKYTDPETLTEHVYYPLVNLGGIIGLKREGKDADNIMLKDASGVWREQPGASMEVLHGTTLIDGTAGKEVGTRLVIRIPAGIQVSKDCFDSTYLEITNPKKNSSEYGYPIRQDDLLQFVLVGVSDGPAINSVEPHVVATEGEKGVQIKGSNFQIGVRVFIDGLEVKNINRDPSSQLITFDAPPGREGETRLIVMNPNGEADSAQFIYVKTQTNPRITRISPNEGTIGTLVVINGDGFLGPDPTATPTGMGIYRLLGARVLFDNEDINEYRYRSGSTSVIEPQGYTAPAGQELLRVENNRLVLADYYPSILLRDDNGQYYTISKDTSQQPVLSDGVHEWTFRYNGTEITASDKSGNIYEVSLGGNSDHDQLTLNHSGSSLVLEILTPYLVDSNHNIVGHRARVVDSGKRIMVTVPNLQVQRSYDVTVINPDTKRATVKEGFYFYLSPQRIPTISSIVPDRGSTIGGYYIDIYGSNFEYTNTIQTRVFIDGVEVPAADTTVHPSLTSIRVKVPPYSGDLGKDLGAASKAVPVVVLNPSDGGSSGLPEGFTYMVPTSQPVIDTLTVTEGTAAGGDYVQIIGRDFRLYEPFQDLNNNFQFDEDIDVFTDINGNGQWDDLRPYASLDEIPADQRQAMIQVLPRVYFGSETAQVLDFSSNFLGVVTPFSRPGSANVYVVNNDYGVSNSKPFTFKGSSPRISSVIPDVGRRQGGEIIEIHGSGLQEGPIDIAGTDGTTQEKTMPLVRFGSLEGTGTIIDGRVSNLDAGGYLKVNYNANLQTLSMSLQTVSDHVYQQTYTYDGRDCFFDLSQFTDSEGNAYGSQELIRMQVLMDDKGNRLEVQRGFAPQATLISSGQIRVTTPAYYTVGKVALSVINPDGSTAAGSFTYRNPDSNPRITNITRDDQPPALTEIEGRQVKILRLNYQGSSQVKVFGQDFRENAIIKVGNLFTIQPDQIIYTLPDQLAFVMPNVSESEIGKLHRVVVINEDGGSAASDQPVTGLDADKIYLQWTKGETEPGVEVISPTKGPASGGTRLKIEGKDFRRVMEGYDNKALKVFIGGKEAAAVEVADYRTIWATTPENTPGTVTVRVENPDGEISSPLGTYTYISSPQVTGVVDPADPAEDTPIDNISVEGGQEIKIKGSGFMPGARVVFAPVLEKAADDTSGNIVYRVATAQNNGYTTRVLDPYFLKEGSQGSDVRYIDERTLTVKTPTGKLDTMGLIVVNPDQGASEDYGDISYELPELPAPEGKVYAEIVRDQHNRTDRAIKVSWSSVAGAWEYEIFVVRGSREEFVGSTRLTSYMFNDLEPRTRYRFIVKAVGNFGSSPPSQESDWVRTGSTVGPPDEDGKLGEKTEIKREGTIAYVNIGSRDRSRSTLTVDLTQGDLAGSSQVVVAIPASVAAGSGAADIEIKGRDFQLKFNPRVFNTALVNSSRNHDDAGIRFRMSPVTGTPPAPSANALSPLYQLEAVFYRGQQQSSIDVLSGVMILELKYDTAKAQLRRLSERAVYRYDAVYGRYVPAPVVAAGTPTAGVNQMGVYTVIGGRR